MNIAIIEKNALFREALHRLLQDPPFVVDAVMGRSFEGFADEEPVAPELIVWGPGAGADVEAELIWLRSRLTGPVRTRFVLLIDGDDADAVQRLIMAGADAILPGDTSIEVLKCALHLVALGQQLFPSRVGHPAHINRSMPRGELLPFPKPRKEHSLASDAKARHEVILSLRESHVLHLLVDGTSNKAIALKLGITEGAVKANVKWVLRKVGASNRTQAATWALNNQVRVVNIGDRQLAKSSANKPVWL